MIVGREMPFPKMSRRVTERLQGVAEGDGGDRQAALPRWREQGRIGDATPGDEVGQVQAGRVQAGVETRAGGRTDGCRRVRPGETDAFGRETIEVRPDPEPKKAEPRSRRATPRDDEANALSEADEALFQHLRGLRATIARAEGIAAFMVFPDRTLIEMARSKPVDLWALRTVHGVGERKREAYGERFTNTIREFLADAKRAG